MPGYPSDADRSRPRHARLLLGLLVLLLLVCLAPAARAAGGCGEPQPISLTRPQIAGPAVLALQEGLAALGLDPGPRDAIFGPRTAAAVAAFQQQHRLQADGVVGPHTLAALYQALAQHPHAPYMQPADAAYEIVVDLQRRELLLLLGGFPVRTYRVAVGKRNTPSPVGQWRIVQKSRDWQRGFGTRWLGLNVPWGMYGIHGTDKPWSIGRQASAGCIRMQNRDVEELYGLVPHGTRVTILGDPLFHRRTLVEGHRGADVLQVQLRLRELEFYSGPLDGVFGQSTALAVRRFQRGRGLPETGIVRWDTYEALGLIK